MRLNEVIVRILELSDSSLIDKVLSVFCLPGPVTMSLNGTLLSLDALSLIQKVELYHANDHVPEQKVPIPMRTKSPAFTIKRVIQNLQ